MQLNNVLIFDIETIPDTEACFNLTGEEHSSVAQRRQTLTDYHLEITDGKNDFLRQPFHKVVALSCALVKRSYFDDSVSYNLKKLGSGDSEKALDEKYIIQSFFDIINKFKPQLVSFNGRTFDIPVLKYRAMKYGISGDYFYSSAKNNYNNYEYRYAKDWHCDLLEVLSDFGASAKIKLNEVCSIFGFPGKFGVDGSKVTEMYDDGKIENIRNYCETDVLNTYLVYLRYTLHRGEITITNYNKAIENILDYITKKDLQYLKDFKEAWGKSCNGNYTL